MCERPLELEKDWPTLAFTSVLSFISLSATAAPLSSIISLCSFSFFSVGSVCMRVHFFFYFPSLSPIHSSSIPVLFRLHLGIAPLHSPLQENQRMQTKLDALTREAFDLQETINWKDKKIGVGGPTWVHLTADEAGDGQTWGLGTCPMLPLHVGDL